MSMGPAMSTPLDLFRLVVKGVRLRHAVPLGAAATDVANV
jgi:hypothetical protein